MSKERYKEFLKSLPEFSKVSNEELDLLCQQCQSKTYSAQSFLCKEGSQDDDLFILQSGQVSVWKDYGTNFATHITDYESGAIIGEIAVISGEVRSATVLTNTKSKLLVFSGTYLKTLLSHGEGIAWVFLRSLSSIIRTNTSVFVTVLKERNLQLEEAYRRIKKVQQELLQHERMANLGKMSAYIMHDLRGPLSTLKCNLQLLSEENVSAHAEKRLSQLFCSVNELESLCESLLEYSRGGTKIRVAPHSIGELIEHVRQKYTLHASVPCEFHLAHDCLLLLDMNRVTSALMNILNNARRACTHGGRIDVRCRCTVEKVTLRIEDSGVGMNAQTLSTIFEPFASGFNGYGLGMVSARNIIEAHDGIIRVESKSGEGTTVYIELPKLPHAE